MKPNAQKVLITGATGFVGSWLTKKLLDLGHDVHILSRGQRPNFDFESSAVKVISGNIEDLACLEKSFEGIQTVFHLAGLIGYTRAMHKDMYQTNVVGTQNVIAALQKCKCEKLVYMSSVVAVGASFDGKSVLDENSHYNLKHLNLGYFETKRLAEEAVIQACKAGQIHATILNPSTIYGPGDAKKGSRKTQLKVARGEFPFYTSGGVNVIHIDDVVNAICRAWEVGRNGERYILAGENITIKNLFEIIAEESGVKPPSIYLPNPLVFALGKIGDALESLGYKWPIQTENAYTSTLFHWFDNSKAKNELGLKPKSAREAIHDSVQWIKQNGWLN